MGLSEIGTAASRFRDTSFARKSRSPGQIALAYPLLSAQAMKKLHADVELHLYATGGHGFAVRKVNHPCEHWPETCLTWLRDHKFLDPH